jgi:hypothetical protein
MNERTIIYAVTGRMQQDAQGDWWPVPTTAVATSEEITTPEAQFEPEPQPESPTEGGG